MTWLRSMGTGVLALVALLAGCGPDASAGTSLLNVSYDPTRELYAELNPLFAADWLAKTGQALRVEQSHGGSGKQARSVADGLAADVVTLALAGDIAQLEARGLVKPGWQQRWPGNSSPYTSTIVFVVRAGNPKQIRDWGDLAKPGVAIVTAHPKTSGGAKWNVLSAWVWALRQSLPGLAALSDPTQADVVAKAQAQARQTVGQIVRHVVFWGAGARNATASFSRGVGDVLLTWENEAFLVVEELGPGQAEIVTPTVSMLAEPPVAVVDQVVEKRGTRAAAEAYLRFLYTPVAQRLIAKHHYRPLHPEHVDPADLALFPALQRVTVDEAFGGWDQAQVKFFADGAIFDQLLREAGSPAQP